MLYDSLDVPTAALEPASVGERERETLVLAFLLKQFVPRESYEIFASHSDFNILTYGPVVEVQHVRGSRGREPDTEEFDFLRGTHFSSMAVGIFGEARRQHTTSIEHFPVIPSVDISLV